ncbi:hypothetical protein DSM112329_04187 [Paraconexibacter sp. AEG42_29]|uniref:Glutathione S-transferase n=1 Tax=Paraconexibacter sp. AEG42_29 TaxID=2997339 RepID=A0AAU7B0C1_9ACTN
MPSHALTLHEHPFASYCQKALIAFYERDVPFTAKVVVNAADRAELARLWPVAKFPVLRDDTAGLTLPESSTIIEYVDALADGGPRLLPADPAAALQVRLWDRFCDQYLHTPMQKIVADSMRAEDEHDPAGVGEARGMLDVAYGVLEAQLGVREWIVGTAFSAADCAAAPPLFYLRAVHRWDEAAHPQITRYHRALMHRPSVRRVIDEAREHRPLFPLPWPDDIDV